MDSTHRDWRRALVRPLSLAVIDRFGAQHGYDIGARLSNFGLGHVAGGTLYPVLRRLEDDGLLSSEWVPGEGGPGKKVYALTANGIVEVRSFESLWVELNGNIQRLDEEKS